MLHFLANISRKAVLKGALMTAAFLGITGGTAAVTFFAVPQKITVKTVGSPKTDNGGSSKLTGKQRFIGNLADSATGGLAITINDLKFDHSYPDSEKTGHNTIEILPGVPGTLDLELSELSLHGIQFALTAPVTYSNNGATPKHRGIHASKVQDKIYLNLFDNGNEVLTFDQEKGEYEAPSTDNPSWDFKYVVDVASVDSGEGVDALTRGTAYYEYGELDWLLADVLEILSEGGISVSLEGWLNNLTGSSSENSSSSSSSFDTDAIMASMDEMTEHTVVIGGEERPYFVWNLPLGDLELPLGFISDSSWGFKGVDLPARIDNQGNPSTLTAVELGSGLTLSAHATVEGGKQINFASTVYGDPNEYISLKNSAGIFEGVARYVAKPQIGLSADFTIGHNEESYAGSRTKLKKKAISEEGILSLKANIDAFDGINKKRALQGFDAQIQIGKAGSDATNDIAVSYLKEDESFQGYLNVNDIMKAKASKTYLDSFYAQIVEDVFGTSADQLSLDQLTELINKLKGSLDKVLSSDLVSKIMSSSSSSIFNEDFISSFKSGTFVGALDLIKAIKNGENTITLEFTTEPVGIPGTIKVLLDGRPTVVENENVEVHNLLSLVFEGIELSSFTLNGTLSTSDFVAPASFEDASTYEEVSHLKGIASQIKSIASSKSFAAKLSASIVSGNEETLSIQNGQLAFDFARDEEQSKLMKGSAKLRLVHNAEKYIGTHDVTLALENDFKDISFHYDSHAETDEGGINGSISLPAAKKVFLGDDQESSLLSGSLLDFFKNDDRFSRLGVALMGESSSSLLSSIGNGEYLTLLENHGILSSFHLGADKTTLSINGSALGLENTAINLEIAYEDATINDENIIEGGISSLKVEIVKTGENAKTISFTLSDIGPLGDTPIATIDGQCEDFNGLASLGAHLMNTLTLGAYVDGRVAGSSSYGLKGSIDLDIAGYGTTLYDFEADAFVEGAETKIHARFFDLPVIRGVNAPDNSHYFRPNEFEGHRDSEIFFYANGVNPEGEALITRNSSYGRLRDVKDAVRVSGKSLTSDFLGWLGQYALGLNESLFESEQSSEPATPYGGEKGEGIHIDDAWKGFSYVDGVYTIKLDLGNLLGISILDEVAVKLYTKAVNRNSADATTIIYKLEATLGVAAKASNSDAKMHIAGAKVSLYLDNFYGENDVVTSLCGPDSEFGRIFVKTSSELADDGLYASNPACYGALYQPIGGTTGAFYSDSYGDGEFDNFYCYDFTSTETTYKGGNFYLSNN